MPHRRAAATLLAACIAAAAIAGAAAAVSADEPVYSATEALPFCEGPQWEQLGQDVPQDALNATLAAFTAEFAPDGSNPYQDTSAWVPCDDSELVAVAEGCRQLQAEEEAELYQLHVIAGCANSNVEFFADVVLTAANATAAFSQVLAL